MLAQVGERNAFRRRLPCGHPCSRLSTGHSCADRKPQLVSREAAADGATNGPRFRLQRSREINQALEVQDAVSVDLTRQLVAIRQEACSNCRPRFCYPSHPVWRVPPPALLLPAPTYNRFSQRAWRPSGPSPWRICCSTSTSTTAMDTSATSSITCRAAITSLGGRSTSHRSSPS